MRTTHTFSRSALLPLLLIASLLALLLTACAGDESTTPGPSSNDAGPNLISASDDAAADDAGPPSSWPTPTDPDSAVSPATVDDASLPLSWDSGSVVLEASPEAAPDAACIQPLGQGVLLIDELMIESVAGTGDYGEWLEVQNTSSCAVNLNGLQGECPTGKEVHTFDVTGDLWIPPFGTFLVADSGDPAVNHYLPGPAPVITWAGQPGDVLRNQGATITLTFDGALVDTLTYPNVKPTIGASIEFPSSCPPSSRSDWSSWQTATASWFPGFYGTPNAPNDDVTCP
jgi:hypothetical protein